MNFKRIWRSRHWIRLCFASLLALSSAEQGFAGPDISWSTFHGGSLRGEATTVTVDPNGDAIIAGVTFSSNFPVLNAFDPIYNFNGDGFVAKFDSDGVLIWSTLLGGGGADRVNDIVTDGAGNVYVVGQTTSVDIPTRNGWYPSYLGGTDAFVVKLNPDGLLFWGTYLGGSSYDDGRAIDVDTAGNVYVAGETTNEGFITKFDTRGQLLWGSGLGGSGYDVVTDIAVDDDAGIFVTGITESTNFFVFSAAYPTFNGGTQDGFVANLDLNGNLNWSTYLGGSDSERCEGIAFDPVVGAAYVTGATSSPDFPNLGAWDPDHNGDADVFLTSFDSFGNPLWSTFHGGYNSEVGEGVAVDSDGRVCVTGLTTSSNFFILGGLDSTYSGGSAEGFVSMFDPTGGFLWTSYLGGIQHDACGEIAIDGADAIYVAGLTSSNDFPTPNGRQTAFDGLHIAFLTKFDGRTGPIIFPIDNESAYEGVAYSGPTPQLTQWTPLVSWSLETGPFGMTIDPATGVLAWPAPVVGSPHAITIRVTDAVGTHNESWMLRIVPAGPPQIEALPDEQMTDGFAYPGPTPQLLSGTPPITWTLETGPPSMTIDPATGVVDWPMAFISGSPHTVTIRATNSLSFDDESWQLAVIPPGPPVVAPISDDAIAEGDPYTGPKPVLTQGTLPVTWRLIERPDTTMTIDPLTGVVWWPDPTTVRSPHNITIRASNVLGDGDASWRLIVNRFVPGNFAYVTNSVRLIQIDLTTGNRRTISDYVTGSGPSFAEPYGIALERSGTLVMTEPASNRILRINAITGNRRVLSEFGTAGIGPPLVSPYSILAAPDKTIFVAEPIASSVLRIDPVSGDREILASPFVGTGPALVRPTDMAFEQRGTLAVVDQGAGAVFRINRFTGDRTVISGLGVGTGAPFVSPRALALSQDRSIFVTDVAAGNPDAFVIVRVHPDLGDRTVVSSWSRGFGVLPSGNILDIEVLQDGNILLTDPLNRAGEGSAAVYLIDPWSGNRRILSGAGVGVGPSLGFGVVKGPWFTTTNFFGLVVYPTAANPSWTVYE